MVRFAHLADVHLGCWKIPELQELNIEAFRRAVNVCLESNVEFVLISGDLFDSAFPSIDILKEAAEQLKKLRDKNIECYVIAGSHDYSVSGKTFLDVLEKAGLCRKISSFLAGDVAISGLEGRKAGLEVKNVENLRIEEGKIKILMLHTTTEGTAEAEFTNHVKIDDLPDADYYAAGHIHKCQTIEMYGKKIIYPGCLFPCTFSELEEFGHGSFYIVELGAETKLEKKEIILREVIPLHVEIKESEQVSDVLEILKDKKDAIVLLRLSGKIEGKTSDINFAEIEDFCKSRNLLLLKNLSGLEKEELQEIEVKSMDEEKIISEFIKTNEHPLNKFIFPLISLLDTEKQEGETVEVYEKRIMENAEKIIEK